MVLLSEGQMEKACDIINKDNKIIIFPLHFHWCMPTSWTFFSDNKTDVYLLRDPSYYHSWWYLLLRQVVVVGKVVNLELEE